MTMSPTPIAGCASVWSRAIWVSIRWGYFMQNVMENLDPDRLEVFAYATAERTDALNQRLRRSIPHWREAAGVKMNDEALARQIRADGIDILVDLAGHTAHNRLPVFAWKPAPVQVSWLGYLGTTGLDAMDYILADAWALADRGGGPVHRNPLALARILYLLLASRTRRSKWGRCLHWTRRASPLAASTT